MTERAGRYATPDAMWTAVRAQIKKAAKTTTATETNLQRQFVYDRFLARVFTYSPDGSWVLKGGTALLARVRSARHSRDIDLLNRHSDLAAATTEIHAAAALDLADHLRFVPGEVTTSSERPGQPGSELATVKIDTYAGVRSIIKFTVDIVIGGIITGEPEHHHPQLTVAMPDMTAPPYLLYPVADHIADKLCATVELHGVAQVPSSRTRDLADLVVIARTQTLSADTLRTAIAAETAHRGLAPITRWTCPATWAGPYAAIARDVAECRQHRTYTTASDLVRRFLDPVLADGLTHATWHPATSSWVTSATPVRSGSPVPVCRTRGPRALP